MAVKRDWWMSFMGESRIKNQESREEAGERRRAWTRASMPL
jgi:hypothetical protein